MGYSMAINIVKKFDKTLTLDLIDVIYFHIEYERSDWAKKNFRTVNDYVKYMANDESLANVVISDDLIEKYKGWIEDHRDTDYGFITHSVFDWCSAAGALEEQLDEIFGISGNQDLVQITSKDAIKQALKWARQEKEKYDLKPVEVNYAFRRIEDEDAEDDYCSYKQISCDGIDVNFGDGTTTRLYNEDDEMYMTRDPEKFWMLNDLCNGLSILLELNLDDYIVTYSRGY